MEMEEQYCLTDLRHLISRPTQFPSYPPPNNNNNLFSAQAQFDHVLVMGRGGGDMLHNPIQRPSLDSTTTTTFGSFDGGSARWPRQETLTLLEVRSRLDHKFKEANQKGPLWDEVARIMSDEHGYQRSGKKCREKFENLYKYYKKTKEGKAGRQDGKHYRFFRQLEALYGDHSSSSSHHQHHHHQRISSSSNTTHIDGKTPHFVNQNPISPQPNTTTTAIDASLSLSSEFATSSSDDDDDGSTESNGSKEERESKKKRKGKQRSWKGKIKEFIDLQMRKIMEKQEAWLEKMMKALEKKEQERKEREEEWKKQEVLRIEREHKFWASERTWIEARDSALMKALEKLTNVDHHKSGQHWDELEITRLIQLRTAMESRFDQCGFSEEVLWEDIAAKMTYFGYERSATICKEKWDFINKDLLEKGNLVKKRKDNNHHHNNNNNNSGNCGVIGNHNEGGLYINHQVISGLNHGNNCEINEPRLQLNDGSSSSPSSHNSNINMNVNVNASNVMNDSCLRFFLGDGENLGWESNYGVKTQQG